MRNRHEIFTSGLLGTASVLAALALTVSACGSSGDSASGGGDRAASTPAQESSGTLIDTTSGADGTHLTSSAGRAVYLWEADTSTASTCSGSCAAAWPPVTTHGQPRTAGAAQAALLGTTKRADGSLQVTYAGHPLYFYAADSGNSTTGQGLDTFGALWWLVDGSGRAITTSAGAAATSTPAGKGPYGY